MSPADNAISWLKTFMIFGSIKQMQLSCISFVSPSVYIATWTGGWMYKVGALGCWSISLPNQVIYPSSDCQCCLLMAHSWIPPPKWLLGSGPCPLAGSNSHPVIGYEESQSRSIGLVHLVHWGSSNGLCWLQSFPWGWLRTLLKWHCPLTLAQTCCRSVMGVSSDHISQSTTTSESLS